MCPLLPQYSLLSVVSGPHCRLIHMTFPPTCFLSFSCSIHFRGRSSTLTTISGSAWGPTYQWTILFLTTICKEIQNVSEAWTLSTRLLILSFSLYASIHHPWSRKICNRCSSATHPFQINSRKTIHHRPSVSRSISEPSS